MPGIVRSDERRIDFDADADRLRGGIAQHDGKGLRQIGQRLLERRDLCVAVLRNIEVDHIVERRFIIVFVVFTARESYSQQGRR